jgi:hypothetical protein
MVTSGREEAEHSMALHLPLTSHRVMQVAVNDPSTSVSGNLISRRFLQQILGILWLLDGLLQLQPSMFTQNFVNGIMLPTIEGQPGPIAAILRMNIQLVSQHIVLANLGILIVQVTVGICLLSGRFLRLALLASVGWSLLVWFGGEGMGMILTGQASVLTGAPGAVLLYAVLGLAAYPRSGSSFESVLSRQRLRLVLVGFWVLTALLQMQSFWWQSQQISQVIAGNEQPGTLGGAIFDNTFAWLARLTAGGELYLNSGVIIMSIGLAAALLLVRPERIRLVLCASITVSLVLWWSTQAFGLLLSGTATDPNSAPLLVVLALACWPLMGSIVESTRQSHAAMTEDVLPHPFRVQSKSIDAAGEMLREI